jgi:hypothetical protein
VILPTKGIAPRQALITIGGEVLRALNSESKTVSRLWDEFRERNDISTGITFDWFVLSLDLLFLFGAVEFDRGRISSAKREGGP